MSWCRGHGRSCAPVLPAAWAGVEADVPPRCTARVPQLRSLVEHLRTEVPELRRALALGAGLCRNAHRLAPGRLKKRVIPLRCAGHLAFGEATAARYTPRRPFATLTIHLAPPR